MIYGAIFIAQGKAPVLADIIFLLFTLGLVLVRFVDIRYLKGETMDGDPATLKHWRRYTLRLLIFAGFIYIAARILAKLNLL